MNPPDGTLQTLSLVTFILFCCLALVMYYQMNKNDKRENEDNNE